MSGVSHVSHHTDTMAIIASLNNFNDKREILTHNFFNILKILIGEETFIFTAPDQDIIYTFSL